jgi:hypothetical protein
MATVRFGGQHLRKFLAGSHGNAHRLARVLFKATLEPAFHRCLGKLAVEHDVAACNVRAHVGEANGFAHSSQFSHWKLAGAADIHSAQKSNVSGHRVSSSDVEYKCLHERGGSHDHNQAGADQHKSNAPREEVAVWRHAFERNSDRDRRHCTQIHHAGNSKHRGQVCTARTAMDA